MMASIIEKRPNEDALAQPKKTKQPKRISRKYKSKKKAIDPTSPQGVLEFEIDDLLKEHNLTREDVRNDMKPILNDPTYESKIHRTQSDVKILKFTSNGDSLAMVENPIDSTKKQILLIPFGMPDDIVTVKIWKSHPLYSECDLISVDQPNEKRDESLINCRYFGLCSGCQFQNISYIDQLEIKRDTIVNAFKFFAPNLTIPEISKTQESPLQYNYRTKLTPHFTLTRHQTGKDLSEKPNVGFGCKGKPKFRYPDYDFPKDGILDIEECSIGTEIINKGMDNEQKLLEKTYKNYERGATILLREDTKVKDENFVLGNGSKDPEGNISNIEVQIDDQNLVKTCVTNTRQIVQEIIEGYKFEFSAGEFFQNNNSILPIVTRYVRDNLFANVNEENYLVDAYCGSGLFSITCSPKVLKAIGVEISADSVKFAKRNAELNNLKNTKFMTGKAEEIFKNIETPNDKTSIILDPPRKGCDELFLKQLSDYKPVKIVYISCNVHSQARDLNWFINESENGKDYKIESIKGFDFFPQTHHVESVAVLSLK
ncbi:unnamed protein product [Candida verbasci]|uniref:tRNA (uracil(54)-C(5))-methyltransferase n=1 Tax=Candida verbasci TaxID=1227364 RepID=A0A9W4TV72_9ASCO|nr:unnamed protein product [Candida verbasci]